MPATPAFVTKHGRAVPCFSCMLSVSWRARRRRDDRTHMQSMGRRMPPPPYVYSLARSRPPARRPRRPANASLCSEGAAARARRCRCPPVCAAPFACTGARTHRCHTVAMSYATQSNPMLPTLCYLADHPVEACDRHALVAFVLPRPLPRPRWRRLGACHGAAGAKLVPTHSPWGRAQFVRAQRAQHGDGASKTDKADPCMVSKHSRHLPPTLHVESAHALRGVLHAGPAAAAAALEQSHGCRCWLGG